MFAIVIGSWNGDKPGAVYTLKYFEHKVSDVDHKAKTRVINV